MACGVLATSREALSVSGEATFQVPSLGMPGAPDPAGDPGRRDDAWLEEVASTKAVRLFVDCAAATTPGFRLDATTAGPLVEICRRLDGDPLAIELAAARVNVLSVGEIAPGLGHRFRLLTGGRRTAVPRQQTLQALIDWSWDLLAEPDQQLLRRLLVFAGGWTLDAAPRATFDGQGTRSPTVSPAIPSHRPTNSRARPASWSRSSPARPSVPTSPSSRLGRSGRSRMPRRTCRSTCTPRMPR